MTQSRSKAPLSLTRTWASAADSVALDEQTGLGSAMDEATTAAELPEVAAAAAPSTEAAPAAPADANSAILEFEELFTALTNQLRDLGYYQDRPEYTVPNKSRTELGMEKRALLTMARERIDILYSLPADKLSALAQQELPYVDRKTKNAMERMAATFVEGHPQPQGFGGEATTQDLVRLVLSGHIAYGQGVKRANTIVSEEDARAMTPGFLKSICTIMPNIMAVVTAEPDAAAMERAEAAEQARAARHEDTLQPRSQNREGRDNRERRGRDGGQDMKPGDWLCPQCNIVNFASRTECFKCYEPRPESAGPVRSRGGGMQSGGFGQESKPGDWPCPSCGANNFARRSECFRCDEPRPGHIPPPNSFGNRGAPEPREGDWPCPECGVSNFSYRGECFRCQAPRPGGPPPARQSRGSFGGRGDYNSDRTAPEMRPGDWMCPDCSAHNFANKVACYRCSSPRPESAGPPIERRSRGGYGGSRRGSSEGWTSGNEGGSQGYGGSRAEPADLDW